MTDDAIDRALGKVTWRLSPEDAAMVATTLSLSASEMKEHPEQFLGGEDGFDEVEEVIEASERLERLAQDIAKKAGF